MSFLRRARNSLLGFRPAIRRGDCVICRCRKLQLADDLVLYLFFWISKFAGPGARSLGRFDPAIFVSSKGLVATQVLSGI